MAIGRQIAHAFPSVLAADEVAESVLFLASDKASFISGHGLALTARTPSPNWFSN